MYREMQHNMKVEVEKAKQRAHDELHATLYSKEEEIELYRSARHSERAR